MREYGSFLELDLRSGDEYYSGAGVCRLNAARYGILHALRLLGAKRVVLPRYMCPSVVECLLAAEVEVAYAGLDEDLLPVLPEVDDEETAVLVANYFGLIPRGAVGRVVSSHGKVVVDHAQAFYKRPYGGAYTVYSPRKFFGVPDGCYVVGEGARGEDVDMPRDVSSGTADFLLKRIELGCAGAYPDRMKNEERIATSGMAGMSALTRALLKSVDYERVKKRRVENYLLACRLFSEFNGLDLSRFPLEEDSVPMVYPLVVEDEGMHEYLAENRVYAGRWWSWVLKAAPPESVEVRLSRYMVPLPVDQRMDAEDIEAVYRIVARRLKKLR